MERIILFAKAPQQGRVKTRLVPPLDAKRACALHVAMLADQWALVRSLGGPARGVELRLDGAWPEGIPSLPPPAAVSQGDGDLGARMRRALADAHARGAARAAVVGADAPSLPRERIEEVFARLEGGADAAIVPALDGGYLVVATGRPCPGLFEDIPWGTSGVLEATRSAARRTGIRLVTTAPWGDVDRPADLARIARELAAAPRRAPRTAGLLASWRLDSRDFGVV